MLFDRLRKSKILLIGMTSLGNEVCKNILLAGVNHLTILDEKQLTQDDWAYQFMATKDKIGQNVCNISVHGSELSITNGYLKGILIIIMIILKLLTTQFCLQ